METVISSTSIFDGETMDDINDELPALHESQSLHHNDNDLHLPQLFIETKSNPIWTVSHNEKNKEFDGSPSVHLLETPVSPTSMSLFA
eukprot:UN04231